MCGLERYLLAKSDRQTCGCNSLWGQEKAWVGLRDLCGQEALKAHGSKMEFVVGSIYVCVGVQVFCESDKITFVRASGLIGLYQPETK